MGILDDVLIDFISGPQILGRRARKLLRDGKRAPATITGILVTRTQEDDDGARANDHVFAYALDVAAEDGAFRAGVRQRLGNDKWRAFVGAPVVVAYDDGGVIIDAKQTLTGWGRPPSEVITQSWKTLDEPPPAGVTDRFGEKDRKKLAGLEPCSAVLVADRGVRAFGMESDETRRLDLELRFADGRVRQQRVKVHLADYVRHLVRPGVVVPAGFDASKERVVLDWLALANEPVRVVDPLPEWAGEPAEADPPAPDVPAIVARASAAFTPPEVASPAPAPVGPAEHGATFDRWIELKAAMEVAGVGRKERDAWVAAREPAVVSWKDLDRHWNRALGSDPALAGRWGALWPQAVGDAMARRTTGDGDTIG